MSSNEFRMETKGHCVLCLKLPPPPPSDSGEVTESSNQVFSFHKLTSYLKLNLKKVFSGMMTITPESLQVLEKADLKGTLCPGCSTLSDEFYQLSLELETIQLKMQDCLKSIHGTIKATDGNQEAVDEYRKVMNTNPWTIFHSPIVERLRKETLERCEFRIRRSDPQVILDKFEPTVIKLEEEDPTDVVTVNQTPTQAQSSRGSPVISTVHILDGQQPSTSRAAFSPEIQPATPSPPTNSPSIPYPLTSSGVNYRSQKRFECQICFQSFRCGGDLGHHRVQAHGGKGFQCRYCPSTFMAKQSRNLHEKTSCKCAQQALGSSPNQSMNPPVPPQVPPALRGDNVAIPSVVVKQEVLGNVNIIPKKRLKRHKCTICSLRFTTTFEKNQHIKFKHGYKCSDCPATYKSPMGLYYHRRGKKCEKYKARAARNNVASSQTSAAINSPAPPTNEEPSELEQTANDQNLNRTFGDSQSPTADSAILNENNSANPEQDCQDQDEPENGPTTQEDQTQRKVHDCVFCDRRFFKEDLLQRHLALIHFPNTLRSRRKFECDICHNKFISPTSLKMHMESAHKKLFECEQCKMTFFQPETLARHVNILHKPQPNELES